MIAQYVRWHFSFLMGLTLTMVGCSKGDADKGGQKAEKGADKGKTYHSPQEVFEAAREAVAKEDWKTFGQCLTENALDDVAGELVFSASLVLAFSGAEGFPSNEKTKARYKLVSEALAKHGVTKEFIEKTHKELKDDEDQGKVLKKLLAPVKDRHAFVVDMTAALKQVAKKPEKPHPLKSAELKEVKIDGDSASGVVVTKEKADKDGPIQFKKVAGSWKLQKLELGSRATTP